LVGEKYWPLVRAADARRLGCRKTLFYIFKKYYFDNLNFILKLFFEKLTFKAGFEK
jgi:hypothetical protein